MRGEWPRDADGELISRSQIEDGYEPLIRAASSNEDSLALEKLRAGLIATEWRRSRITANYIRALLAVRISGGPTTSLITALYRANEAARLAEWQRSRAAAKSMKPPVSAEFIARLITRRERREYVMGCRAEDFCRNVDRYGRGWAVVIYWCDTARDLPLWVALKRALNISIVADFYRRFRGL